MYWIPGKEYLVSQKLKRKAMLAVVENSQSIRSVEKFTRSVL